MAHSAQHWLKQIKQLPMQERVRILNVCGGHERTITQSGIRSLLADHVELIPGPGCPVCVCPEEDIYQAIQLALRENITLVAFGDMLRVPVNLPKSEARSLLDAQARGADIRPVASPLQAVEIAQQQDKPVVFFATGFETTTAPVAGMLSQGIPENLFILLSGRLTWPAVALLLEDEQPGFDALIAPGHVATVMGPNDWNFVVEQHHYPTAIAGFNPDSLLESIYSVIRQHLEHHVFLDNCYPSVVHAEGNLTAQQQLHQTMDISDANWRGIGSIPKSGYRLSKAFQTHDASLHFTDYSTEHRKRAGEMPPGCDCAKVVLGKIYPNQCKLFGKTCVPENPVGPCMVSDEGACRIWWANGIRDQKSVSAAS